MLVGHYAVGLASKRLSPQTPLWALIGAPIFLDLLWPIALLTGIESVRIDPTYSAVVPLDLHDYPYTHSLAAAVACSVALALGWLVATRDRRAAIVIGLGGFSHWVLDWITHPPDMPLYPGSTTQLGLGLWHSVPATLAIELALFGAAVAIYASVTRARDRTGSIALWSFVAFLLAIYLASVLGPPPPSPTAVAVAALTQWPLLLWARSIDSRRVIR